jgi:hypothetical protein
MSIIPKKLAVFYGWPSTVNGAGGNVADAVNTFKVYDLVVFGTGIEEPTHGDHANVVSIINHPDMANTEVYGYIDAVLDLDDIQTKIDLWAEMGVKGIFMDRFGYDFGVSRDKQRTIVWSIHRSRSGNTNTKLKAFVNGWNPDDVFSPAVDPVNNPSGKDPRLNSKDWYMAESFVIMDGEYDDSDLDTNGTKDWQDKATKLANYRNIRGTKIAAITTYDNRPYDSNKADFSYNASVLNTFDAWGWGEPYFSAGDSNLPYRDRADIIGTAFTGGIINNSGVLQRQTNVGIKLDTDNHTVGFLLDL